MRGAALRATTAPHVETLAVLLSLITNIDSVTAFDVDRRAVARYCLKAEI
jgi:hypothetical protein